MVSLLSVAVHAMFELFALPTDTSDVVIAKLANSLRNIETSFFSFQLHFKGLDLMSHHS